MALMQKHFVGVKHQITLTLRKSFCVFALFLLLFRYYWDVVFVRPGGSYPLMDPKNVNLYTGTQNATIFVERRVRGGINLEGIPGDFLRVAHPDPQVRCQYMFDKNG